jgi:hypothetical protein
MPIVPRASLDRPRRRAEFHCSSTSGYLSLKVQAFLDTHREASALAGELVTIPLDLSTRTFIHLPRFFRSRRTPPLFPPSLGHT